jgi:hypothetical protein
MLHAKFFYIFQMSPLLVHLEKRYVWHHRERKLEFFFQKERKKAIFILETECYIGKFKRSQIRE